VTALNKQAAAVVARHGIEMKMSLCEEPDVPLPVKEVFYRISQEALQNAVKHARPSRLEVQLSCEADCLVLEVQDNGIGFNPEAAFPGHLGLRSMQERASSVGGSLAIISAPQKGTKILARVPLDGEKPAD
jgi:signal transduction histidine kinase